MEKSKDFHLFSFFKKNINTSSPMLPPITDSIADGVGSTPMIRLTNQNKVSLLAKLEFANPTGSSKDRIAKYLLDENEKKNPFKPSTDQKKRTLIIPTSGNLGISLATLAAKRNYRIIAILPERTSNDRVSLLKALGVEILRSPNEVQPEAPESAPSVAARLAEQLPHATVLDETQLRDLTAYHALAEEILQQTKMAIDYVFVGVESGASITGIAQYLKSKIPEVKVIGVVPMNSTVGSNHTNNKAARPDWKIEDIGNSFIPQCLENSLVDEWVQISDKEAYSVARRLIRDQGILGGPSSGAVMAAASRHAQTVISHTTHTPQSVIILNDDAKNYTSTLLSDDWLFGNNLADDLIADELDYISQSRYRAASVEDLQLPSAITVKPNVSIAYAQDLMFEHEYSQLPVIRDRKLLGYVSMSGLQEHLKNGTASLDEPVEKVMFSFKKAGGASKYQVITPDTSLADLAKFFEKNSFAVVTDAERKWCLGIATKYDLISFLHRRQFF
ncbi:tryptophan synthase beta subunit-like PLP-dependent enzyme [Blakeslea trispora]|nr:tryptophan synthase beta subunit-like PLP-dependent enzyme [Blakeslea trispora]